jgi:anti-anti-sigma factor
MLTINKFDFNYVLYFKNVRRFDIHIADEVYEKVSCLLKEKKTNVILNLEGIKFIDSSATNVLQHLNILSMKQGSSIHLTGVSVELRELLDLTRLSHQMNICKVSDFIELKRFEG